MAATARHAAKQGSKPEPNQVDPRDWVYDLGENGDLSVDALISDNVRDLVALFRTLPNAKGSFATKGVTPALLGYDPQGRTRIRMSLMPHGMAKRLDVRAPSIAERMAFVPELHRAGYEVHLNFSPVVLHEGWEAEWTALFAELDAVLPAALKQQLAAEIIMLTHNEALHDVNLAWHPKAEEMLWRPDIQEEKRSEAGGVNLRYRTGWKGRWLARFQALLAQHMPYCRVRYAF
jgi:DNA repair photolyase